MQKFRIVTIFIMFSLLSFSQEIVLKNKIDSIVHSRWGSATPDWDSLDAPKIVELKIQKRDTVILKMNDVDTEVPITPFVFMNTIKEKQWFLYGQNNMIFNQSSYSNWNAGGYNSIGVIGRVNYSLSYKNGEHFWDNNVKLAYGMLSISGRELRKTEDNIYISTKYGYDIGEKYYLLMASEFSSQFSAGYNYSNTRRRKFSDRISRFMAPAYLNFGLGVLYNPTKNFQISLSPINAKFTFVLDKALQKRGKYGLERDGQSVRKEVGAMLKTLYHLQIYKGISWVNQLTLFSNYIQNPQRVDLAYNGVLRMKFNKFISTVFSMDLVYDHDQVKKLQMKQTLGVELSYNFGVENKEKNAKKDRVKIFLKR